MNKKSISCMTKVVLCLGLFGYGMCYCVAHRYALNFLLDAIVSTDITYMKDILSSVVTYIPALISFTIVGLLVHSCNNDIARAERAYRKRIRNEVAYKKDTAA